MPYFIRVGPRLINLGCVAVIEQAATTATPWRLRVHTTDGYDTFVEDADDCDRLTAAAERLGLMAETALVRHTQRRSESVMGVGHNGPALPSETM